MRTLALAVLAAAVTAGGAPATPQRAPVSAGYPYASSCPSAGYADKVDRWSMYECNCTSYAAWALAANHQRVDWFVPGRMDAGNWPSVARSHGLETGSEPRAMALAVWPYLARPYGHIAYVTAVNSDGTFDVGEYNLPSPNGRNTYVFDRRRHLRATRVVFVYVPRV